MYTDGIKLQNSSNQELWILGATLLDLPMKVRSSQKNFIFIAAWYGLCKPIWSTIADHVTEELGKVVKLGNEELSLAVLQVNADIPARASILNCMNSGYFPCLRCDVQGLLKFA